MMETRPPQMPGIDAILGNEALRREEFPVVCDRIFWAHAGVCVLPRRVSAAVREYASRCEIFDQEAATTRGGLKSIRLMAGDLLGANPDEIALVGPTSLALSFIAAGLDWEPGENVVVYYEDYPSNVYPWMALHERGVEVRRLETESLGRITRADVERQVDSQTRLVALASCHFISGFRIDIDAIGEFLHDRGILFSLDAIQTVGAMPTRVDHVDFLAADAHKWMLGPCAAGILYVRKSLQSRLRPPIHGWHNILCPDFVARPELRYQPDARRYEVGTPNLIGLAGLQAALQMLAEIGVDAIARELLRKRNRLVPALQRQGWEVLGADEPEAHTSGITSITRSDADLPALHRKLADEGIVVSLRRDRNGREFLRLSPHFYNSDAEMDRILMSLE